MKQVIHEAPGELECGQPAIVRVKLEVVKNSQFVGGAVKDRQTKQVLTASGLFAFGQEALLRQEVGRPYRSDSPVVQHPSDLQPAAPIQYESANPGRVTVQQYFAYPANAPKPIAGKHGQPDQIATSGHSIDPSLTS